MRAMAYFLKGEYLFAMRLPRRHFSPAKDDIIRRWPFRRRAIPGRFRPAPFRCSMIERAFLAGMHAADWRMIFA